MAAALPKKKIPWQNRERWGNSKAFWMTLVEALISPADYYEKLIVSESYQDALVFCFINSLSLISPLVPHIFLWSSFFGILFILAIMPLLLFFLSFIIAKIFSFLGEESHFSKTFHVLAYATPAFIFVYVPGVGYGLATIVCLVLTGVGLTKIHKIGLAGLLPVLLVVSLWLMIPYSAIRLVKSWELQHPVINKELEAQKVLAVLSVAAENYASQHGGTYPASSKILTLPPQQYLVHDYCGQIFKSYRFNCDFRDFGYFIRAEPQGWQGRGKKVFYVTTGGKLRAE